MSLYLLDTSALIDYSKGFEPSTSRIQELLAQGDLLGVCGVNLAEFYTGVLPGDRPKWDAFVAALEYWDLSRSAAIQAGVYRNILAKKGQILSTTDMLVAAAAMERGATLLTDNVKHFPVRGLKVQSIRQPRSGG